MNNFSVYPTAIDGYATLPIRIDGVHEIRADDVNRLRDAIIKIEQELGVSPSATFATVADRLDSVANAEALISSHIANPVDAHDASAISILDSSDNYVSTEVEGALGELASVLPASLDVIGEDDPNIPNDGIPSFVGGDGRLHVFNISAGANEVKKTQPVDITGVHIIDVGENNGTGTGTLTLENHFPATLTWSAPGDPYGPEVDISSLGVGEVAVLESSDGNKRIRITRSTESIPAFSPISEDFDLMSFDAKEGTFSIDGVGFKNTINITRTASPGSDSNYQFMVSGMVFPADKGTLVLQRKLNLDSDEFKPIAVLDLGTIDPGVSVPWADFDEDLRNSGQKVYIPSLQGYDTITLFDRYPAKEDYGDLGEDADGNPIYEDFNLNATFSPFQIAKYLMPASNSYITYGELESPLNTTSAEIDNKISSYRVVHYKTGITDFSGTPLSEDIFSISDTFGDSDDGDNTVRISNIYVDTDKTRPGIENATLMPSLDVESNYPKLVSGVHYYNSEDDKFNIAIKSNSDIFANTYLYNDILRFTAGTLHFPSGDGYGLNVDIVKLLDDGYSFYSESNLPDFSSIAYYIANESFLDAYRPSIESSTYDNNVGVSAMLYDPFGAGDAFTLNNISDSYTQIRILANSFDRYRATDTKEWFTDESRRVGTIELFDFPLENDQFTFEDGPGYGGTLEDWDETLPLSPGELQCGGLFSNSTLPGLVYPQEDYTSSIRPSQQIGADYSAFSGDAIYQRLFNLGFATNGGRVRIKSSGGSLISFDDIDFNNANRPIKISVKIPGQGSNSTGFMDIGKLFETESFDDDSGALAGSITGTAGDFIVPFTFGTRNTADTGNMIAIKITYLNSALADAKTRIISYIELLEP